MLRRIFKPNSAEHFARYRVGRRPVNQLSLSMGMNNWRKRVAIKSDVGFQKALFSLSVFRLEYHKFFPTRQVVALF